MRYHDKFREKLARIIQNQSELSRKTGLSQSAISEIVGGRRRGYFDQIVAIASKLGISLDWLADERQGEIPVPEFTEDERIIIQVYRDFGYDRATALRMWQTVPVVKPLGTSYGDIRNAKQGRLGKKNGA